MNENKESGSLTLFIDSPGSPTESAGSLELIKRSMGGSLVHLLDYVGGTKGKLLEIYIYISLNNIYMKIRQFSFLDEQL